MRLIGRLRPSPALVAVAVTPMITLGGVALASIPGSGGKITTCYSPSSTSAGTATPLQVVDTAHGSCPAGTAALTFDQTGPRGPTGASGSVKGKGARGPAGPRGRTGPAGPPGPSAKGEVPLFEAGGSSGNPTATASVPDVLLNSRRGIRDQRDRRAPEPGLRGQPAVRVFHCAVYQRHHLRRSHQETGHGNVWKRLDAST